jgi:hypothetical protein
MWSYIKISARVSTSPACDTTPRAAAGYLQPLDLPVTCMQKVLPELGNRRTSNTRGTSRQQAAIAGAHPSDALGAIGARSAGLLDVQGQRSALR